MPSRAFELSLMLSNERNAERFDKGLRHCPNTGESTTSGYAQIVHLETECRLQKQNRPSKKGALYGHIKGGRESGVRSPRTDFLDAVILDPNRFQGHFIAVPRFASRFCFGDQFALVRPRSMSDSVLRVQVWASFLVRKLRLERRSFSLQHILRP